MKQPQSNQNNAVNNFTARFHHYGFEVDEEDEEDEGLEKIKPVQIFFAKRSLKPYIRKAKRTTSHQEKAFIGTLVFL